MPPDGYTKFHAAEDNGNRQGGLISLDVRLGEIQFDAAKNGGDVPALEILTGHAPFQTSKDNRLIKRRAGIAHRR